MGVELVEHDKLFNMLSKFLYLFGILTPTSLIVIKLFAPEFYIMIFEKYKLFSDIFILILGILFILLFNLFFFKKNSKKIKIFNNKWLVSIITLYLWFILIESIFYGTLSIIHYGTGSIISLDDKNYILFRILQLFTMDAAILITCKLFILLKEPTQKTPNIKSNKTKR